MQNEDLTKALKGKTVSSVDRADADMGIIIHFTDGTCLEMYYSAEWGETTLNNKPVDVVGTFEYRDYSS